MSSCRRLAEATLRAIGEDPLRAWAAIDPERLLAQADGLDRLTPAEQAARPLYGVPIGIKDNFDTAGLPTAYGSPIYAGHRPAADSEVVSRLRAAGALIVGKTHCAEFAWMTPPPTRNPRDPARTPGGSSNGSAAAVGGGMVPLATGTQTAGSVIRPAAYCGVFGYKPSFGLLPRAGIKLVSPTLDTVGLFARRVADLRRLAGALGVPGVASSARTGARPRLGVARTPLWGSVEPEAAQAVERWLAAAGVAPEVSLPGYERLTAAHQTIQAYEGLRALHYERRTAPELLSAELRAALDAAAGISDAAYQAALRERRELGPELIERLRPFAAVITPSAPGAAPLGLGYTGDPVFCRVWSLLGAPAISAPLAVTADGLPIGIQLVAPPGADGILLSTVETLVRQTDQMAKA